MNDLEYYSVYEFVAEYKQGNLSRREMMKRVLHIAGGVASAASVLALMGCGSSTSAPASSSGGSAPQPATARAGSAVATGGAGSGASPASASSAASTAAGSSSAATSARASNAASSAGGAAGAGSSPSGAPSSTGGASSTSGASTSGAVAASPAASGVPGAKSPISVAPGDPAVDANDITFQGNGATLMAYEARPKGATGVLPVVLVCHENMGLTPHIRDVARRYAKEGYLASALDLLSREGGTAKVTDRSKIPALLSATSAIDQEIGDFKALADYYTQQKATSIGINGFCFGGGIVWRSTEAIPALKAAVPFYGALPPLDQVKNIKAAVLGVYSADPNDFANKDRDKLDQALKEANVTHQFKVYPGTRHAFNNDTGSAYNQQQALAAWKDTLAWFGKYLKA